MPGIGRDLRRYLTNQIGDCYVALSVAEPLDDCSGFIEANTIGVGGYARQPVTWDRSQPLPTAGQPVELVNTNTLTFTSTAAWSPANIRAVSWVACFDTTTGTAENIYVSWAALTPAKLIDRAGITITIPAGALKLSMGLQQY